MNLSLNVRLVCLVVFMTVAGSELSAMMRRIGASCVSAALLGARRNVATAGQNFGGDTRDGWLRDLLQLLSAQKQSPEFIQQVRQVMRVGITSEAKCCVYTNKPFEVGECIMTCEFTEIEYGLLKRIIDSSTGKCFCCNVKPNLLLVEGDFVLKIFATKDLAEGERLIFSCLCDQ